MDFILNHASEIMQLCFGAGFLIFMLVLTRIAWTASRIARKVDLFTDMAQEYLKKPLEALADSGRLIAKIIDLFEARAEEGKAKNSRKTQKK